MSQGCVHATSIVPVADPLDVCEFCVLIGSPWVHLRQCLTCGRTLCCDSSPNRHASRHARDDEHPIVRGADPGDDWVWCFADDSLLSLGPDGWELYDLDDEEGESDEAAASDPGGDRDDEPRA